MARILKVEPGTAWLDEKITIDLGYDQTADGGTPTVVHVIFHDNVNAPNFNVTGRDSANRRLTVEARVPADAVTGPIQVELDGIPPISTNGSLTVDRSWYAGTSAPLAVRRVDPSGSYAPNTYSRNGRMTIWLSRDIPSSGQVYFPRSDYGPPTFRAASALFTGNRCWVQIPADTGDHGRVKIVDGTDYAVTSILTFVDGGPRTPGPPNG